MISRGGVQTDTRTGEPFEMPLLGRGRTDARALTVDTWKAMTSQYCRERRKKVLVSAEIAAPDTDLELLDNGDASSSGKIINPIESRP